MVLSPLAAGRVMIGIGLLGILASLFGTLAARQLVIELDDGVARSLTLSAEVLDTLDDSFTLAHDTMELVEVGMADAESATRGLEGSLAEGRAALGTASALTGGELADSLASVEATLPDLEQAAAAMDRALSTLDALPLGVSYGPDRPLNESIAELRQEMQGLPDELRVLAEDTDDAAEGLGAAQQGTAGVADSLGELSAGLGQASLLLDQYAVTIDGARVLVAEQRQALEARSARATWGVVALGLVFAMGQFVPIYLGVALTRGVIVRAPTDVPIAS